VGGDVGGVAEGAPGCGGIVGAAPGGLDAGGVVDGVAARLWPLLAVPETAVPLPGPVEGVRAMPDTAVPVSFVEMFDAGVALSRWLTWTPTCARTSDANRCAGVGRTFATARPLQRTSTPRVLRAAAIAT
jgi:hypothetical protein